MINQIINIYKNCIFIIFSYNKVIYLDNNSYFVNQKV